MKQIFYFLSAALVLGILAGMAGAMSGAGPVSTQFPTALPPNGSASGDLSGSYPSPTVAKIGGHTFTVDGNANELLLSDPDNAGSYVASTISGDVTVSSLSFSVTNITNALGTGYPAASGANLTALTPANISAGSISSVNLLANPFRQRMPGDVTNSTATFSNLTGISCNRLAGRKYTGRLMIKCNNSTAAEGIKLDFNGGTATVSEFWAATSQLVGGTDVLGTTISTSLSGVINFTTITGETLLETDFSFICTASTGAGTFIPRTAENSHTTGTLTTEKGTFLWLEDMP